MSTTTESSPIIEQSKQYTLMCQSRLLKTLSFVPDEKLNWSPAPGCKSPLRIAAHCGRSNGSFLTIITGGTIPPFTEDSKRIAEAEETAITTREEAISLLEVSTQKILSALESLTADQVSSMVATPMFTAPMTFWMNLPGRHMDNHASQIDLLQTCWGDMDWHI